MEVNGYSVSLGRITLLLLIVILLLPIYDYRHLFAGFLFILCIYRVVLTRRTNLFYLLLILISFLYLVFFPFYYDVLISIQFFFLLLLLFSCSYSVLNLGVSSFFVLLRVILFLSLFVGVFQILKYSFGSYDFFGRAVFSKDRFSDKFLLFFNYPYPRLTTWYYGFGEFGGLINSGIFLSFILIRNWFFKLFSVLVLFYALYLTGARASYLAFFLSFIFFINRFSYKLFSSFIIFISISILPLFFLSALDDFHFLGGGTVAERLSGYVVAAKQILSSPIGHGPNHWEHIMAIKVYGEGEEVALHNSMLWFGYVAGLPVLLLFLSHLWYFILSWRGWSESTFSRGLFCTFSSAFLSILFSPFFTNYLMFILIGVLFWYVRNREKYSFC